MPVRMMQPQDLAVVTAMMRTLCPDEPDYDFSNETVFVWEHDGQLGGFISVSLRMWAEGCHSMPVPYIEGWWVAPHLRRKGIGSALVRAVQGWCLENGYKELGSDVEWANKGSLRAHARLGFVPTVRLQFFRKVL